MIHSGRFIKFEKERHLKVSCQVKPLFPKPQQPFLKLVIQRENQDSFYPTVDAQTLTSELSRKLKTSKLSSDPILQLGTKYYVFTR
mmetsp:Transcript_9180/g.19591  ORF Transcript_9180/g.19591 Transcript_9180/m.19591 type:complete len:86 (+) Transcript_9180:131-388(+)